MPSLNDARDAANPLGEPAADAIINALLAAGIKTDRDVLMASDRDLAAKCSADLSAVRDIRLRLAQAYVPPLRTGRQVLEGLAKKSESSRFLKHWTFGCEGIDSLLDGGIQMGDVIELSGAASQGKTQLSLFCSLCAILLRLEGHSLPPVVRPRDSLGTVLYLDTANAFSPTRILELFNGSDRFQSARESGITNEDILTKIRVSNCFDIYTLLQILGQVDYAVSKQTVSFFTRLQLVVIDSIATVLSPILSMKQSTGQTLMASVARMIRSLAANGIAVLVVNHAVSAREEGMARGVKPALGVNWQAVPTVRLFLRSDEDDEADEQGGKEGMVWTMEAADGRVLRLNKRVIEVRNSTRTKVGTSGEVYIGSTEIICE